MNSQDFLQKLAATRARVEATFSEHAVITVTSAAASDGKSLVAAGLAASLAEVGHEVLLVDGNPSPVVAGIACLPRLSSSPEYDPLSYKTLGSAGMPAMLGLSGPGVAGSASRRLVNATFERFRTAFAFTIIDAPRLAEGAVGLSLIGAADGVIVAFQQSRAALEADHDLVRSLEASGALKVGVVMTDRRLTHDVRVAELLRLPDASLPHTRSEDARSLPGRVRVHMGS